mmetsp:Transcript_40873/g.113649  ORF Transcript_40873/g.113649 Transcript_40873/m.113649 type:complete len:226 (-) Transcript_40873:28-705(-)
MTSPASKRIVRTSKLHRRTSTLLKWRVPDRCWNAWKSMAWPTTAILFSGLAAIQWRQAFTRASQLPSEPQTHVSHRSHSRKVLSPRICTSELANSPSHVARVRRMSLWTTSVTPSLFTKSRSWNWRATLATCALPTSESSGSRSMFLMSQHRITRKRSKHIPIVVQSGQRHRESARKHFPKAPKRTFPLDWPCRMSITTLSCRSPSMRSKPSHCEVNETRNGATS